MRDLEKQLELEQLKSDRREYLYAEGAISQEQLDEVAFNSQALSERLANAQSNLDGSHTDHSNCCYRRLLAISHGFSKKRSRFMVLLCCRGK
ncbi:MAG: hypothetical protein ACRC2S_10930 [Waterburya sp.]